MSPTARPGRARSQVIRCAPRRERPASATAPGATRGGPHQDLPRVLICDHRRHRRLLETLVRRHQDPVDAAGRLRRVTAHLTAEAAVLRALLERSRAAATWRERQADLEELVRHLHRATTDERARERRAAATEAVTLYRAYTERIEIEVLTHLHRLADAAERRALAQDYRRDAAA